MLVSEANRILSENNLHALPVVDGRRLRGLVTRANLLRMGHFVRARRIPTSSTSSSPGSRCGRHGAQPGHGAGRRHHAALPAGAGSWAWRSFRCSTARRVIGVISANEIFQLAAHCLGPWEHAAASRGTPRAGPGRAGPHRRTWPKPRVRCCRRSTRSARRTRTRATARSRRRSCSAFHAPEVGDVVAALEAAGFPVLGSTECALPPPLAA